MIPLIIYKSRGGATKQYATWIYEDFPGGKILTWDTTDFKGIPKYSAIVICSATYGGEIEARNFIVDNWEELKIVPVYLVVVGIFPEQSTVSKRAFDLIPEHIRENLAGYVKLPGKAPGSNKAQKMLMGLFGARPQDVLQKKSIAPIINFLNSLK